MPLTKVSFSMIQGIGLNVADYGAKGDGSTDDTAAIAAALAALPSSNGVLYFGPGNYLISSTLSVSKTGAKIYGQGAKITQSGTLQQGFNVSADQVEIHDLWIYNSRGGADWSDPSYTNAIGIVMNANYCRVSNCRIENWGAIGIRALSGAGAEIVDCVLIGIGAAGGLVANSNHNTGIEVLSTGVTESGTGLRIRNNRIINWAQGITTAQNLFNLSIEGNEIVSIIGQHGIYCDNIQNLAITGNVVNTTALNGIKVQVANGSATDTHSVSIVGNTVSNVGDSGIAMVYATGTAYQVGVTITGNAIYNPTADGIQLYQCDAFVVSDNTIVSAGQRGIASVTGIRNGIIANNFISSAKASGLYLFTESTNYHILVEGNHLYNCVTQDNGAAFLNSGIVTSTGAFTIRHNRSVWVGTPPATYNSSIYVNTSTLNFYDNDINIPGYNPTITGATVNNTAASPYGYKQRSDVGTITLDARTDAQVQEWTAAASNVDVVFSTATAIKGDKFRIVKQSTSGGTVTINLVTNTKVIASGTRAFADVQYDGTQWNLTGYGTL